MLSALRLIGVILTLIGGILLGIVGIIYLSGNSPLESLSGITGLILGLGLLLAMLSELSNKKEAAKS